MNDRSEILQLIRQNIDVAGYHTTFVGLDASPRFAYTIGLHERFDAELIFAGGCLYSNRMVEEVFSAVRNHWIQEGRQSWDFEIDVMGENFSLRRVDKSWVRFTVLGVLDYYDVIQIPLVQVVPPDSKVTIDIPDMTKMFGESSGVWQYLDDTMSRPSYAAGTVIADIDFLTRKFEITELVRVDFDEWEMFTGDPTCFDKNEIGIIPIGVALHHDNSLIASLDISVGKGLYRADGDAEWIDWV